jgi:A/G-specific adenine glycosylase
LDVNFISSAFRRALSVWFRHHKRDLPWRHSRDPYAILVSEIMLQQTQAATVVPYYNSWLRRFPSLRSLAAATESDVLHAWQGLGYYARARNLHRCAQIIVKKFGGNFPRNPDELKLLPGIGRYTANAVGVFAFGKSLAIVEANTARVLARLFNIRTPTDSALGRRKLWDASAQRVPKNGARDFQNAMMDLGALVCTVHDPNCRICPVKKFCRVRLPELLPRKGKRAAIVPLIESHGLCTAANAVLLQRCRQRWRGMWMLPQLKRDYFKQSGSRSRLVHTSVFPFTHHRVTLRVYRHRPNQIDHCGTRWFSKEELETIPIPSPHRRVLVHLLNARATTPPPPATAIQTAFDVQMFARECR